MVSRETEEGREYIIERGGGGGEIIMSLTNPHQNM